MPRGKNSWFETLFGFTEGSSYRTNRNHFRLEGPTLVCPTAPRFKRQHIGLFTTPSLSELRTRLASAAPLSLEDEREKQDEKKHGNRTLTFKNLATPVGVQSLIMDPKNAGCFFQAASQFNCLEMVGPGVSPARGISIYFSDPTQGPKCALSCPAGTVYRNYLCQDGKGQIPHQIDCLHDLGQVMLYKDILYIYLL